MENRLSLYYNLSQKLMNDFKRKTIIPAKIASNLQVPKHNLQPEWSRNVTNVHQTKDLHTADYTQLYDFLKQIAQRVLKLGQDNQMQMVRGNGENQFRQYAGQNVGNQVVQNAVQNLGVQNVRNQNGVIVVLGIANQNGNGNVVAARDEGNANGNNGNQIRCYNCRGLGHLARIHCRPRRRMQLIFRHTNLDEIEEVNANCILMANLQQASTSDTSNLQTELERTKECFENCIIKKENEYAKLWNDWYKKCEECKYDKISYDKAYNDMQQKIERLQAQLGDYKGIRVYMTTNTRRPQPRCNTMNDRVPSASKSSRIKNKEVENDKSKIVCVICKQCLITANHDVCVLNYVNGMNSRSKKQKANVSNIANQMKHKAQVWKLKNVGSNKRLASPKPSKPRMRLRWSPTGKMFDIKGKLNASSESNGDNESYNDMQQMIKRLQAQLGDLKGKSKDTSCVSDTLDPLSQKLENENVELEFQVWNYEKEIAHLKTTYKNLFDSISVTRAQTKTLTDSLQTQLQDSIYENAKLRAQLFDKVSEQKDKIKGTSVNTLFAKQSILGKPPSSSKSNLYSVTPFPKSSVLPKVDKTNALSKPVTSNSLPAPQESKVVKDVKVIAPGMFRINPSKTSREDKFVPINKVRESVRTNPTSVSQPRVITKTEVNSDSNGLSSTGVNNTAKTRRPQPMSNTKNDKVTYVSKRSCSKNKEIEVEEHHRNLLLSKKMKHVSSDCNNIKLAIRNDKSKFKQMPKVWKPKKVGSKERLASPKPRKPSTYLRWSPTGRMFDLTRKIIVSNNVESHSDCSNGDNACFPNPQEPKRKQFPNSSFSLAGTVRFGNDHVATILGFGDLQWGNILITRVYFIEGLGHNLFSVGQFCDSDLEVTFRRNTCFVRNLEGVDLLKGNRTTNLYTFNLYEMASASPIFLMARATSTKSWLWHQRLSHLNFDTINDLAINDLVTGLPKFKYHKEHLCPSCEQGKIKRASHPPKPVLNSKNRLHLLHMDLCSPMRIASINRKRYRITVLLQAPVMIVRTDNGTEFKNQVLQEYFNSVGISHQTSSNDREDIGKLGAKGDIGFFIGYSANSCAYRVYNQRTKKIMETMNVTFDEVSAMAFEQSSSKPGLQSDLDLLFEAIYDDYLGGQPSTAPRIVPDAQAPPVLQNTTTSTAIADSAPTPTISSPQALNNPNTSQDVDELETQQQHVQQ
ncbi:retrovirus-related pol polyprotein from transposon TNT 1-94 [Tanacetum coccineum]|uniref:Retrovirus-related pol polyprotein from transposon TNT 1-94 n=1 Tax=Tanacetum coccineum TaxID=301880 RepID=A0ABQ4WR17_9ASTR